MTTTSALTDVTPAPALRRFAIPLALLTLYVIWGSTYLALRWVVEAFPPMLAAGSRYLIAGIALLVVARVKGTPLPDRRAWLRAAPIGLLLFMVGNGFVSIAEREVSSSQAAIVCGAMPLVTVLFGAISGERPRAVEVVGLLVGFSGVVVMTAAELGSASGASILLLFAPIGWALGSILTRRLSLPGGFAGAAMPMVWGGIFALLLGLAMNEGAATVEPSAKAIGAFVYLIIAGSMIAFTAYSYLLRHARQSVATSYAYVNPVVATLLGIALGGERLGAHTLLGGALVVVGVGTVIVGKANRPKSA
jgi:drug/metabolite transporter (DMT)-like permease